MSISVAIITPRRGNSGRTPAPRGTLLPIMLEFEQTPNPLREDLAIDPIVQCKGQVSIPSRPGLGIEVNRTIVDRYRVN